MKPLLLWLLWSIPIWACCQSADEILQKADKKMRGSSSQAILIIKTVRPTWSRELTMKVWMKGKDLALLSVQSPAKEKGIIFLKRKKEVWNWIPTLERTIKLPPSMMSNSWMGTDFTNDDLVRESSITEDYTSVLLKDTMIDQRECYFIQCIPKPQTAIVWSKLHVAIDKKDFLELYTEFYDDEGTMINTMKGTNIQLMDGRLIPTHFIMTPTDKKNQHTEINYREIFFDRLIDDHLFTLENIKSMH